MRILKVICCADCPHITWDESHGHYVCGRVVHAGEINGASQPVWCPLPKESEYKFEIGETVIHMPKTMSWRISGGEGVVVARAMSEHAGFVGVRDEYYVSWVSGARTWHVATELGRQESRNEETKTTDS